MAHIFAVSDGTGITAERVVQAALTQFDASQVTITRYGKVRTEGHIREIVAEASQVNGFIVHTLVSEASRRTMLNEGRTLNVTTIDLMGPLLVRLSDLLAVPPRSEPGLLFPFDASYMQRIDAIDFAVRHDDGANVHELYKADIVLVGVSRTSKTPVSIYLAYRGWKVANIPIVLHVEPPEELFKLPSYKVIALTIQPDRLVELRRARLERIGTFPRGYADLDHVRQEVTYAYHIFDRRRGWQLIDVTSKPIEEIAAEVVTLLGHSSELE
ncbi:MAG: pyruvate, water dikinase regulatory protein [Chloroflexota bacterium]